MTSSTAHHLVVTDDTRITVRLEGEVVNTTTLGLFLVDNFLSASEKHAIRELLARGAVHTGGGGAQPEWSVEVAR